MKLYLMSDDISVRAKWMGALSGLYPITLPTLSFDIESDSIVMVSETLLRGKSDKELGSFFRNKTAVLSIIPNFSEAQRVLALGAMGYGNAMMHESHLHSIYQALEEGNIWLHPDFITMMIVQIRDQKSPKKKSLGVLDVLSTREKEVALMLGEGATHQEISDSLNITVRTVKAHATAIYQKLEIKDRLALSLLLHQ